MLAASGRVHAEVSGEVSRAAGSMNHQPYRGVDVGQAHFCLTRASRRGRSRDLVAAAVGWAQRLSALGPPRNRTCDFHRIRLEQARQV